MTRLFHLDHFNSSLSGLPLFGQIDVEPPTNDYHFRWAISLTNDFGTT
jgi:hypothetical protein